MAKHKRRNLVADVPLEELRAIPGFPGYYITAKGVPYSIGRLSVVKHNDGYWRFQALCDDGSACRRKRLGVHRALALAFHGEPPAPGLWALHKDGDVNNNVSGNVYWGTPKENGEDRVRHGHVFPNSRAVRRGVVCKVRAMLRSGARDCEITRELGVCHSTIHNIVRGSHYLCGGVATKRKHLDRRGCARDKLTVVQVREIRRLAGSVRYADLSVRFGVSEAAVRAVIERRTWKRVV